MSQCLPAFAYLFERFPSFTQTFTVREVQGVTELGLPPRVYSIRRPEGEDALPQDFPAEVAAAVRYLPTMEDMRAEIRALRETKELPKNVARKLGELNQSGDTADKGRFYEAAWLGLRLREEGIRHVHVHFAGIAARTAWMLKSLYGISYSITAHANDFFVKTGHRVSLADLVADAAFIAHVSEYGRGEMAREFPAAAGKMLCVYNGINLAEYEAPESTAAPSPSPALPPEWQGAEAPPLILSIGRLIEKKGFSDLIAACGRLRAEGAPFRCAILGEGPLRPVLEAQISALGLGGHVLLAGNQPQGEVRRLLRACAIFALACTTEADGGKDNLPTVITEAMALGKPVVSTTLAGVPEQVQHGHTGLLSAPGDPEALADHLAQLLAEPETARALGLASRERAQAVFALGLTAARLAEALVLRGRARPPWQLALKKPRYLARRLSPWK